MKRRQRKRTVHCPEAACADARHSQATSLSRALALSPVARCVRAVQKLCKIHWAEISLFDTSDYNGSLVNMFNFRSISVSFTLPNVGNYFITCFFILCDHVINKIHLKLVIIIHDLYFRHWPSPPMCWCHNKSSGLFLFALTHVSSMVFVQNANKKITFFAYKLGFLIHISS